MEELQAFERLSDRQLAADILQHVIGEHGMMWRWSGSRDAVRPHNLPHLYRMVTFEMVKIGNVLDQLRELVFDSDRSKVKVTILYSLIDAVFQRNPCGRKFSEVIVTCAIVAQLSLFCCCIEKHFLVNELVDLLGRIFRDRVGDNFPALERFARAKLGMMIPEAA